jgi:Fe2+ or Zn2+ uptake regulation protein
MKTGEIKQRRREESRRLVLEYLVNRSVLAFSAAAIQTALKKKKFSISEIESALQFQVGAGRVSETPDPQGSTRYYKATAEGVLFHERNPQRS